VLYWMQQSQLMECNHSLEYSVQRANELGMGVVVVFELIPYFLISIQYLDLKIV
jgi:hypothetical protein